MSFGRFNVVIVFLATCTSYVGGAGAAVLATDPAAMDKFHGSQQFLASIGPLSFSATVDYAVYAPGAFHASAALDSPTDPSEGTQYVYAYQLFNAGTANQRTVGELSIGFDGDQSPANLGVISGTGFGINPASMVFVPTTPPYASVNWTYSPELTSGQSSNVLLFTSPNPPAFFNASVAGGGLANQQVLPSPVPEPSTSMVLAAGAAAVLLRRRR